MSGPSELRPEYTDGSRQGDGEYVDVTRNPQPTSKEEEARAESSRAQETSGHHPPPEYSHEASASTTQPPPLYDQVEADIEALAVGDPNETIPVPMIQSIEKKSFKTLILRERGKVFQTVLVRKMPRSHYLKHYAKDANGKYVGTEKPAVDAGLVFVPSKSTPEDILEQVRKVAFGKEHYVGGMSGVGAVSGLGGGGMF